MKLGWRKRVEGQNKLLGEELGRSYTGANRYKWVWSEDGEFFRSKLVVYKDPGGKLDPAYKIKEADPESGRLLARVEPEYTREKLLPKIANCYVMCRWMDNGGFEEFRARFGDKLEWPGEGSYFPVEHSQGVVQLYPNQEPGKDDTWEFIRILRKDTQLGMEGILAQMERNEKSEERRALDANMGKLSNVLPAYDHIPGKRGSGGIWARGGEKEFDGIFTPDGAVAGGVMNAGLINDGSIAISVDHLLNPPPKPPRSSQIMDQQ